MAKKCLCSFFDQDAAGLIFAAFRYYKGRMTISACDFARRLSVVYPKLPESYQALIRKELDDDFDRDDESREKGEQYHPLGMSCDREAWELVRQAYRKDNP